MTIAITGANGHVGANLVRTLLQQGERVRVVLFESSAALEGLDVQRVQGDVRNANALRAALRGAHLVFHLAGNISIDKSTDAHLAPINIEGTRNVALVCREVGARLVHFSSIHASSPYPRAEVVDETRPLCDEASVPAYDRSKADGERAVMQLVESGGLDAVTVAPSGIIGPHDYRPSLMGRTLLEWYDGRAPGLVTGGFNWVDVRDVVDGAIAAAKRGARGARYLLTGHWLSVTELAKMVHATGGKRPPRFVSPMWLARTLAPLAAAYVRRRGGSPRFTPESLHALRHHRHISHDKATRELGYAPRPLEVTVADTLRWFAERRATSPVR